MEGAELTSNFIKNIISEILRECHNYQIGASTQLVAYYINLLELDPNRNLTYESLINRENVQQFVRYIVKRLGNGFDPTLMTLRLQCDFNLYMVYKNDIVRRFRKNLRNKLYPLMVDIVEQENRITGEKLYQKICYYVTLASGLGNPSKRKVFKEVLQVVRSVISDVEIEDFPDQQNYIKQEILRELVDIVAGIRLYNKACKRGGEDMPDLPNLLAKAIVAVKKEMINCQSLTSIKVEALTRYVEMHMTARRNDSGECIVQFDFNNDEEKKNWEMKRDFIAAHMQMMKVTNILLEATEKLDQHRQELTKYFNLVVEVLGKTIIPTLYQAIEEVFPYFTDLSNIWKEFQNDAIELKEIFTIFKKQGLKLFSLPFDTSIMEIMDRSIAISSSVIDEELTVLQPNPMVCVHKNNDKISEKDLQFEGYCCWKLVHTGGALAPANINLGVVQYKRKFYGFSSNMAINCFTKDPNWYIMSTLVLARKRVHLVHLLNLEKKLKKYLHVKVLVETKEETKVEASSNGTQTDTHFEDGYMDYKYVWNAWYYKKSILKHNDLKRMVTRGTETDKTHQKASSQTQTFDMKNSMSQTMSDNYGNTKRPLTYIYGLLGSKENNACVLDLTDPLSCSSQALKK